MTLFKCALKCTRWKLWWLKGYDSVHEHRCSLSSHSIFYLSERKSFYFWCEMFRHRLEIWFRSVWVFDTLMLREQTKANIFSLIFRVLYHFYRYFMEFFFRNHQTKLFIFRQAICLYCSIKVCIFYNSQRIFIEPTLLINTHGITSYKIELKTTRLCFPMSNSKMF